MVMTRRAQMLSPSLEGGGDGARLESSETGPSSSGEEGAQDVGGTRPGFSPPPAALYEAGTHERLVISLLG